MANKQDRVEKPVRRRKGGGLRRFLFVVGLCFSGLYLVLHLVLASQPVQKRVLGEIQKALSGSGLELTIESIEFAAFAPKIYLNRVTLKTLPSAPIVFPNPLAVDKLRIEFQPLALISGRVVIEDLTLFHPRIVLPSADQLYRRVDQMLSSQKRVELQGGFFKVIIKKFGVVDALIDVSSQNPPFSVRSHSLTVALDNNLSGQQTVTASSSHVEIKRGALALALSKLDLDIDISAKSLRVNRALVEGGDLYLNLKGSSNIPQGKDKYPSLFSASYDVRVPLPLLNQIPELSAPKVMGVLKSAGNVRYSQGNFSGSGQLEYDGVLVEGVRIGGGRLSYALTEQKLLLSDLRLNYANGLVSSKEIVITLKDRFPISGTLQANDIKLEALLDNLKQHDVPLQVGISGPIVLSGGFSPFELHGDAKVKTGELWVYHRDKRKPASEKETVIRVAESDIQGRISFNTENFSFTAKMAALGGALNAEGYVNYDDGAKIKVKSEGLSLTKLQRIAELDLGGMAKVSCEIDVVGSDPKISGTFEATDGEVANILLGPVKGQIAYHDRLLAFENLELATTLEPVKGNGFVDFNPDKTHYKFNVEGKRMEVDQVFRSFAKRKLAFAEPHGGEVGARLLIEGGHDADGVEVIASGQGKNFTWYREEWLSSQFSVVFRAKVTELGRVLLMKKSGGIEIKGNVGEDNSNLQFISHGLRVEELQAVGKAPLSGQIVGQMSLHGDLTQPEGNGEIRLVNSAFRGKSLPDSVVRVRTENNRLELLGRFFGEKLRGRLAKPIKSKTNWDILVYFEDFDFTPLVAAALGQDLPSVTEVAATGEIGLSGDITDWKTFKGNGSVSQLELGLRGTPMKNKTPIRLVVEQGTIQLDRMVLSGKDSQVSLELHLAPQQEVRARIDGKIDLEFLQPFIPGLEYGTGRVAAGLRFSGPPEKFDLLGNISLQDATFRIAGFQDDFRNANVQLSVSQDRINIDRFQATINGGLVEARGDVRIDRFEKLIPNITFSANRVTMKTGNYLATRLSGDFALRGESKPYLLSGKCRLLEANLTSFNTNAAKKEATPRIIRFDIHCEAKNRVFVRTDVMNAEMKGNFNLVGDNNKIGLLGSAEAVQGFLFFRERKFTISSANVKFESPEEILPRFNVAGSARVREGGNTTQTGKLSPSQEYDVNLLVYGTPENYKIRLTSSPELAEAEIISLLLLGVTSRGDQSGSAVDLGTTIVGQIPLQSKLESQLGLDIRINTQTSKASPTTTTQSTSTTSQSSATSTDITVPSVQIQKDITDKTRVSYSNTLENVPVREFKIEHMLDDNVTLNGVAVDRSRTGTESQSSQSYGLDFRYRFQFE